MSYFAGGLFTLSRRALSQSSSEINMFVVFVLCSIDIWLGIFGPEEHLWRISRSLY